MTKSLVVNRIIDSSASEAVVASNTNPVVMSVSEGDKILLRDDKGLPANDIFSFKEQNDLVVLSEDGQEILRVTDYFITNDVDIGTWVNNDFISYQFSDVQTGTITTQLSSEQPSALIYEMLDNGTVSSWETIGLLGAGLALSGIAFSNSGDSDNDKSSAPTSTPNTPPTSEDTDISVKEDKSVTGKLATATDKDGDTLTYAIAEQPTNGNVTLEADGSYSYTPNANFNGNDSFTYTINDGNGGVITHTANITVTAEPTNPTPNTPPTSEDTLINVEEDKSVTGKLATATDKDGDTLTYAIAEQPTNGSVTVEADGSYTYTPNADFNGSDSFTYTIDDGKGGKITQTASITITPENDAPTSVDSSITVVEDKVATGILSEADDVDGDTLTYAIAEQPANGSVTVEADGSYTYTPNANYYGTDRFTYTIDDGNGSKITQTASITITPENDAPTSADSSITVVEDKVATGKLSEANDKDGDTLTYAIAEQPTNGSVTVEADGSYTYTPNANFNGSDSFTYTIDDGKGGKITQTASITITPENDAPTSTDTSITVVEDKVATGKLSEANDKDGDTLTYTIAEQPANGSVTVEADGSYTYTPNADFNGTDTFTYTVDDGNGGTITKTSNVTVNNVNDIPNSADETVYTIENKSYIFGKNDFKFNDVDNDSIQSVRIIELPTEGVLYLKGSKVTADKIITIDDIQNGKLIFEPKENFAGKSHSSFTFKVISDANLNNANDESAIHTITVDILKNNGDIPYFSPSITKGYSLHNNGWVTDADISIFNDGTIKFLGSNGLNYTNSNEFKYLEYDSEGLVKQNLSPKTTLEDEYGVNSIKSTSFGNDGKLYFLVGANSSGSDDSPEKKLKLFRFNSDGSVDSSFNASGETSGMLELPIAHTLTVGMTVSDSGKIAVVSNKDNWGKRDEFEICQITKNGEMDIDFASNGVFKSSAFPTFDFGYAIDIKDITYDNQERLLIGGDKFTLDVTKSTDSFVLRITTDGNIDYSFADSAVFSPLYTKSDEANSVYVMDDDNILVTGNVYVKQNDSYQEDIYVIKTDKNGSIIFNKKVDVFPMSIHHETGTAVTVDSKGKIYVTGYSKNSDNAYIVLIRLNSDGSVDETFNPSGLNSNQPGVVVLESLNNRYYYNSSIAVNESGDIFISTDDEGALFKFNSDGTLNKSFGELHYMSGLDNVEYKEDETIYINPDIELVDADAIITKNYAGSTIEITRTAKELYETATDIYSAGGNLQFVDGKVILSDIKIGSYYYSHITTGEYASGKNTLSITFDDNATHQLVNECIQSIQFSNKFLDENLSSKFIWKFTDVDGNSVIAEDTINLMANTDDAKSIESLNGNYFAEPLIVNNNIYYHQLFFDNNIEVHDTFVNHDSIDIFINNGNNTNENQRDINIEGKNVKLPTIDELLDIFNDNSNDKQANPNWNEGLHWSATEGSTADTHKALNLATGEVLEMLDTEMAFAVYQII